MPERWLPPSTVLVLLESIVCRFDLHCLTSRQNPIDSIEFAYLSPPRFSGCTHWQIDTDFTGQALTPIWFWWSSSSVNLPNLAKGWTSRMRLRSSSSLIKLFNRAKGWTSMIWLRSRNSSVKLFNRANCHIIDHGDRDYHCKNGVIYMDISKRSTLECVVDFYCDRWHHLMKENLFIHCRHERIELDLLVSIPIDNIISVDYFQPSIGESLNFRWAINSLFCRTKPIYSPSDNPRQISETQLHPSIGYAVHRLEYTRGLVIDLLQK